MPSEKNPIQIKTIEAMIKIRDTLKRNGARLHFIPTMGALHEGHESLIRKAMEPILIKPYFPMMQLDSQEQKYQHQDENKHPIAIVSIFINPVQFNNEKDLINYPKPIEKDMKICQNLGVQYVFNPSIEEMYPNGYDASVICTVHGNNFIQGQLEGKSRPGHFTGMLTVVNKLFNIIRPDEAFFGEKDYQQLLLVQRMVQNLNMGTTIRPVATVREPDGLPLSSRNIRLQKDDRPSATMMSEILIRIKNELEHRSESWLADITDDENQYVALQPLVKVFAKSIDGKIADSFISKIDYIELRCSEDLGNIVYESKTRSFHCKHDCLRKMTNQLDKPYPLSCRLLAAVEVGGVRLLDNVEVILNQNTTLSL